MEDDAIGLHLGQIQQSGSISAGAAKQMHRHADGLCAVKNDIGRSVVGGERFE